MPAGSTHDRITLWCLPALGSGVFVLSRSASLTLSLCSSFLFSGLMFGPDLDIYSRQFQRWGVLRFIWLPYRKSMRHRSWLSHGPIIGTGIRLIYLGIWISLFWGLIWAVAHTLGYQLWDGQDVWQQLKQVWQDYPGELLMLLLGLELGAMSHACSDGLEAVGKAIAKRFHASPQLKAQLRAKSRSRR